MGVDTDTGLHDGQVVQVHATGFGPNTSVRITQCVGGSHCRILSSTTTDGQAVRVQVAAGYFDLGQTVSLAQCTIPVGFPVGPPFTCGPRVDATASSVDASIDTSIVAHALVTPAPPTVQPSVDCRITACGVAVFAKRYDLVQGAFTIAAVVTSTPSTTSTVTPIVTTTPVVAAPTFTG
jgi:hypothetical protein